MMRVIAGTAKGRKLKMPQDRSVRPSSGRLKEALFSSLGPRVAGANVLDLYAGSGALGIEALSRGGASATFVDRDPACSKLVSDNLESTGLGPSSVICLNAEEFLENDLPEPAYDIVLIDPPYDLGLPSGVLELLRDRNLLADGGIVVLESSRRVLPVQPPSGYKVDLERRYGDSALIYMSKD